MNFGAAQGALCHAAGVDCSLADDDKSGTLLVSLV